MIISSLIQTLTVGIGISPIQHNARRLYCRWGNDPRPEDNL